MQQYRQALTDELARSVGVVGVGAHNVAVGVGVKILYGQRFHAREHIVAKMHQSTLRYCCHQASPDKRTDKTDNVDARHRRYCRYELLPHLVKTQRDAGGDAVVNKALEEHSCDDIGNRAKDDADRDDYKLRLIVFADIIQKA